MTADLIIQKNGEREQTSLLKVSSFEDAYNQAKEYILSLNEPDIILLSIILYQ